MDVPRPGRVDPIGPSLRAASGSADHIANRHRQEGQPDVRRAAAVRATRDRLCRSSGAAGPAASVAASSRRRSRVRMGRTHRLTRSVPASQHGVAGAVDGARIPRRGDAAILPRGMTCPRCRGPKGGANVCRPGALRGLGCPAGDPARMPSAGTSWRSTGRLRARPPESSGATRRVRWTG